tara:strand:- start:303 stop:1379 length:1077 start_codon:yes stop_codon:yes gene_type:complete
MSESNSNTTDGVSLLAKIFNLAGIPVASGTTYLENQWKNYFKEGARDVVYRSAKTDVELIRSLVTTFSTQVQADKSFYVILDDAVQTILEVLRDGHLCKEISEDLYNSYHLGGGFCSLSQHLTQTACENAGANWTQADGSIYQASSYHPIYTIDNSTAGQSKIKVLPKAPSDKVLIKKIDYTNIDAVTLRNDTSVDGVSFQLENLIVLFTAIRILNDTIVSQTDAIVTLAGTIETALNTYLGDGTMRDALDTAKGLIDSKAKDHSATNEIVTTDATEWINDEDSEMIQAVMMVAQQEVSRAGVELTSQLESVKLATQKLSVLREKLSIYNVRKQELQQEYYGRFGQEVKQPPQQKEER